MPKKLPLFGILISALLTVPVVAQKGTWNAYDNRGGIRVPQQSVDLDRPGTPRDPIGILRGQGISSRYGGMGTMGGGSGRSANTGIGLGGIGANQGARF